MPFVFETADFLVHDGRSLQFLRADIGKWDVSSQLQCGSYL